MDRIESGCVREPPVGAITKVLVVNEQPDADLPAEVQGFANRWDPTSTVRRKSLLSRISRAAELSGVCPQIYAGTLLGFVREAKILDWDDDIDIATFNEPHLAEFLALLSDEGLSTFDHPNEGAGNTKIYDSTYDEIPGQEYGPYTWPFVDLFVFEEEDGMFVCECDWNRVRFDASKIVPAKPVSFQGAKYWVPADEHYGLDAWYADWRTFEESPRWNHRQEKPIMDIFRRRITTINGRKVIV